MSLVGRFHAARTLARMARWLSNWREVWAAYRAAAPLPPLRLRSGLVLHHEPGDDPIMLFHEVFVGGCYRREVGSPAPGSVLLDLGANVGAVALDWLRRAPVVVEAYEPNTRTRETLVRNLAANDLGGRARVHPEAVARGAGELRLDTSIGSVGVSGYGRHREASGETLLVPTIGLDAVVARVTAARIWLLKIDTEGAECDILEGASAGTLSRIDHVSLEYHGHLVPGAAARCRQVLERSGFACLVVPTTPEHGILRARRVPAT